MDKLDKLLDVFEQRLEDRAAQKAAKDAEMAKEAKISELEEKVAKLEAMPAGKKDMSIEVGAPDRYKGFLFRKQFTSCEEYAPDNPKDRDRATKEFLDVIDKFKNDGFVKPMTDAEGEKAMSTSGGSGGYFVPETWASNIEEKARLVSVALQDCRKFPIINGQLHIPKQGTSVTVTFANEGSASSESTPGDAELTLTAKRAGLWGVINQELLDDAAYDVVGYVTRDCVEQLGQTVDDQVFNGTQFTGLLPTISTNAQTFGTSATSYANMVAQDWYDAAFALASVRRRGARFYLPKELMPTLMSLTTGTGGVPLMSYLGGAQTASIAGYPFTEVEAINGTDATSTDYVAFGNLQNYALGMKLYPSSIELNPWSGTEFKQYQVLFRIYARMNGAPIFEDLFVKISTA